MTRRHAYNRYAPHATRYTHCIGCGALLDVRDADQVTSGFHGRACVEALQVRMFGATVRELAAHPERAVVAKRTVSESSVAVMMAAYQKRVRR